MIIRCSACTARYLVDPAAFGAAGRRVRCVRCGHVWDQSPPKTRRARADWGGTPLDVPERPGPPLRRRDPSLWIGLAAAGLIVAAVLAGLVLARNAIVEAWPGTVHHYDAVGLSIAVPHTDGLRIADVQSARVREGERTVLLVRGVVESAVGRRRTLPALQVVLADEAGNELHRWPIAAVARVLEGGQSTVFEGWLEDPPAGAATLSVGFAADSRE